MHENKTSIKTSKIQKIKTSLSILKIILTIGPRILVTLSPKIILIQTQAIVNPVTSENHDGKLELTNLKIEFSPSGVPNLSTGSDTSKAI